MRAFDRDDRRSDRDDRREDTRDDRRAPPPRGDDRGSSRRDDRDRRPDDDRDRRPDDDRRDRRDDVRRDDRDRRQDDYPPSRSDRRDSRGEDRGDDRRSDRRDSRGEDRREDRGDDRRSDRRSDRRDDGDRERSRGRESKLDRQESTAPRPPGGGEELPDWLADMAPGAAPLPMPEPMNMMRLNSKTIYIPSKFRGGLIGTKGAFINEIRMKTGCTIQLGNDMAQDNQFPVQISGNVEQVESMIMEHLDTLKKPWEKSVTEAPQHKHQWLIDKLSAEGTPPERIYALIAKLPP